MSERLGIRLIPDPDPGEPFFRNAGFNAKSPVFRRVVQGRSGGEEPGGRVRALPAAGAPPRPPLCEAGGQQEVTFLRILFCHRVGDPEPDPHVFGPPGSGTGSISQRYGSFSNKYVERNEIMPAK
jgi:hypothetical protein